MNSNEKIWQIIKDIEPQLVEIRRTLHKKPELGFKEVLTTQLIEETLQELDRFDIKRLNPTGVCAIVGNGQNPTIALRADIDALTVDEQNEVDYRSQNPGVMHACGHDGHTAILLGVAKTISKLSLELPGTLKLIFQPSEEGPVYGAPAIIDQGVLENPSVDEIYALHLFPAFPQGKVVVRKGPILAGADSLYLTIIGRGGHGGVPQEAIDAITIASQVVTSLQMIISRQVDPAEQAVLTLGTISGGTRRSVIAETVDISGTLRTFDQNVRDQIVNSVESILLHTCQAFGGRSKFESQTLTEPIINDPQSVSRITKAVVSILGEGELINLDKPLNICEDFSYYLKKTLGAYMLLGCRYPGQSPIRSLHSPSFDFDEKVLLSGVAVFVKLVLDFFGIQ